MSRKSSMQFVCVLRRIQVECEFLLHMSEYECESDDDQRQRVYQIKSTASARTVGKCSLRRFIDLVARKLPLCGLVPGTSSQRTAHQCFSSCAQYSPHFQKQ